MRSAGRSPGGRQEPCRSPAGDHPVRATPERAGIVGADRAIWLWLADAIGARVHAAAGTSFVRSAQTVLCAGAIHSPAVLMRSGIGAADDAEAGKIASRPRSRDWSAHGLAPDTRRSRTPACLDADFEARKIHRSLLARCGLRRDAPQVSSAGSSASTDRMGHAGVSKRRANAS
jgi:choline dehydrogenase-like flavoprotein